MSDDFETAARAEAMRRFPHPVDVITGEPVDDWGYEAYAREAHIEGWHAARAHLAEQEPTDPEVLAALNADYALRFNGHAQPADTLEPYGNEHVRIMRAALEAARDARRDEEKRNG